jgi:Leucine-rich repeat (LRR) protein
MQPRGKASERELAAKAELAQLGALVVMDATRTHVNSVNLSTAKSPETLDRAVALVVEFPYLRSLNVTATQFNDSHAELVGQLMTLQDLVLSDSAITDAGLAKLAELAELNTLHLADTEVTNAAMPAIAQLSALKIIDISGTKVSGNLETLRQLPNLNWLVAQRLSLDAEAIASMGKCESLSRLSLRDTSAPPDALDELSRTRPELTIDR